MVLVRTGRHSFFIAAALSIAAPAAAATSGFEDRFSVLELMDRYGIVHDLGSPEEYADLFTADGEIALGNGKVVVKGRDALIAQAKRDHERFGGLKGADGSVSSIMRHIVSNREVRLTGRETAEGSCYVTTMIKDGDNGPAVLSISRYVDRYQKVKGVWRIAHRVILIDYGNQKLGKQFGF